MDVELDNLLNASDKRMGYESFLNRIFKSTPLSIHDCQSFLRHAVQESLGLVLSRQLLIDFIQGIQSISTQLESSVLKSVLEYALDQAGTRATAFEEQVCHTNTYKKDFSYP